MARPKGTEKNGVKYLSEYQLKHFKMALEKRKILRDEVMMKLTLFLGLRVQELVNIKLKDIDSESHSITIQGVKGGRLRTYSDIEDRLWNKLNRWVNQVKSFYKGKDIEPIYLFYSPKKLDCSLTTMAVQRLFKFYAKIAGIPEEFSIHSLRHTCAIIRAKANESQIRIMYWLRHRT